jgi:2-polyprenyl-3-methyl-5-hydroxy-6-metoxy-1,4-benzoquinol methylase
MDEKLARQIAELMGAPPELLPYLPELLADLAELGSSRRVVVDLLRPLGLPPGSSVLDLGCGKGAVLLALGEELGFRGVGVDAFPPFIEAAQRAAAACGLSEKCQFRCADLRSVVTDCSGFDVAMMIAVGNVVGTWTEMIRLLRGCICPGGFLLINDAFLAPGTEAPVPGYEGYTDHDDTLRQLTTYGDTLLKEHIPPPEEIARTNQANTVAIRRRAEGLARRRPELAHLLRAYVHRHEQEAQLAQNQVIDTTWLLQVR